MIISNFATYQILIEFTRTIPKDSWLVYVSHSAVPAQYRNILICFNWFNQQSTHTQEISMQPLESNESVSRKLITVKLVCVVIVKQFAEWNCSQFVWTRVFFFRGIDKFTLSHNLKQRVWRDAVGFNTKRDLNKNEFGVKIFFFPEIHLLPILSSGHKLKFETVALFRSPCPLHFKELPKKRCLKYIHSEITHGPPARQHVVDARVLFLYSFRRSSDDFTRTFIFLFLHPFMSFCGNQNNTTPCRALFQKNRTNL